MSNDNESPREIIEAWDNHYTDLLSNSGCMSEYAEHCRKKLKIVAPVSEIFNDPEKGQEFLQFLGFAIELCAENDFREGMMRAESVDESFMERLKKAADQLYTQTTRFKPLADVRAI